MSKKPIIALIVFAACIFMFAWFFTDIFLYFLISMVLATILKPIVIFFSNRLLFPKVLSIFTAVGVLIIFNGLLFSTFLPLISVQVKLISAIDLDKMIELVKEPLVSAHSWLKEMRIITSEDATFQESIKKYLLELAGTINIKAIFNTIFSLTGSVFIATLAVSFTTFFLAYNPGMIKKILLELVPNEYFEITVNGIHKVEYLLGRYFRGIFMQMFSIFMIVFMGLTITGVNYAVTIALFAAIINLIPYLGPLLGAIFGIVIGVTTSECVIGSSEFYYLFTKIGVVFGIVQVTDNVLLQPIIFSKSLKAHPLEIFVIIFVGANLGGALGMVLAMPFYTIFKVSITELLRGYKQYRVFNKI